MSSQVGSQSKESDIKLKHILQIMQCQKCENTAVYTRKYSGESLCSECFSNSILRKAAKTISKYKMIKNDELVVVGVSGGKDSLVLLSILKKMSETHNFRIIAVTIDEGIPGYRDEALEIVKSFCSKLDVEFRTYSYKELYDVTLSESLELRDEEKTTSCSICGIFRRRALDHAAEELGANVIATGHNLDDSLQTFLINTLSGDSNKIGWMSPGSDSKQIRKIKPLAEIFQITPYSSEIFNGEIIFSEETRSDVCLGKGFSVKILNRILFELDKIEGEFSNDIKKLILNIC